MHFVTVRELRSASAKVWNRLDAGQDLGVSRDGRPLVRLVHVAPTEIDATLAAFREVGQADGTRSHASFSQALLAPDLGCDDAPFARD